MKRSINKIISIFILISIVISNLPIGVISAYVRPSVAVSMPSRSDVNAGESVSFTITYSDAEEIYLSSSYVTLNGFSADVSVSGYGNSKIITLYNVQGTDGKKSISIKEKSAINDAGYAYATPNSYSFNLINNDRDNVRPSISVSSPNYSQVYAGGTVVYTVSFADNNEIAKIHLSPAYITLNGFSANVSVGGSGNTRMITLSNIQGAAGKKNISIKAGAASDAQGNLTYATSNSESFTIVKEESTVKPATTKPSANKGSATNTTKNNSASNNTNLSNSSNILNVKASTVVKSTPQIITTCNDNSGVLGDINKNVKTFSTWLTSNKENNTKVSLNNYVAKNEKITYFVDYYNGAKDEAKGVKIKLTIPYNVDVIEINGNGYIKTQTAEETVVEWDKNSIKSEGKCRLYVKVKYLENTILQNSQKISEEFYVTLKTEYNSESFTSYLRQLFVDTNSNKKETVTKYLSAIDNTNSIRPDDKITRAELAKLLVDSGVVKIKQGSNDYTKYKDAEEIPTYAREAVSSLYTTGIIDTFSDSEFKPNNPIVRDEFFKIVAKAAEYISSGKLKVNEPTFIYTDIVDDKDKTLNNNTNYIMELIRQNIIAKENTKPDEYIIRKDAVQIINALTFRGPYVENLGDNKVKFVDVSEKSDYFYNIIGAACTYTYNYSENLEHKILEIK